MSKRLRTSFNQFVREKVIQGVNNMYPEAEEMPLSQLVSDITDYSGYVEYQDLDHDVTGSSSGNFFIQGPMGYGNPPTGPGTKPFKCFLSNKIKNNSAASIGAMTGQTALTPSIRLDDIHYSGLGATFSVGLATQYRYASDPTAKIDKHTFDSHSAQEHALVVIHGLNSTSTPSIHPANDMKFMYKNLSPTSFQLFCRKGDMTTETIGTPQTFVHMESPYGRMLPVHFLIKPDGTGEFRVDNAKILFDITSNTFTGSSPTPWSFAMSTTGSLSVTIAGMTPYSDNTTFGMQAAISRLTNVAVNDNNPSPCVDDVELPPFIHGVPCTPIRRAVDSTDSKWEMPSAVNDGMGKWTSFSENNPSVSYGLSAIMDNQTFDTRGVATSALNAELDIFIQKSTFENRINGAAVTDDIEAINVMAYNAATFDGSDFAVQIAGHTDWTVLPGLYDDPTIDSHLSFFHKSGTNCPQFNISDFASDLVFKLRAQQGAPTMTFYYINEHPSGGAAYTYPLFASADEALYYEQQVGNPASTSPTAMTFSNDPTGAVWYMPTTAHQQTYGLTPVQDGVTTFNGNTITWNEISTT